MSSLWIDSMPAWAMCLGLAAHLAAGTVFGCLHFYGLWRNACRFVQGGRLASLATTIALAIGRFALLGGLLTMASREGAWPLLAMALGVLIARTVVIHEVREAAP